MPQRSISATSVCPPINSRLAVSLDRDTLPLERDVRQSSAEKPDYRHRRLLRACCERPRGRRAANNVHRGNSSSSLAPYTAVTASLGTSNGNAAPRHGRLPSAQRFYQPSERFRGAMQRAEARKSRCIAKPCNSLLGVKARAPLPEASMSIGRPSHGSLGDSFLTSRQRLP